jgi:GNAT superfamily N-acetyltransferase
MPTPPAIRPATLDDIPRLRVIMDRAISELQRHVLTPDQIEASRAVMGLDTQLIRDGTYFAAMLDGEIASCGGWSWRATLYGGDHSTALRDAATLDPATDPARIRAMYTDPAFARRGVGASILNACLGAARSAGFAEAELMATLSGEPLYRVHGFREIERIEAPPVNGVSVPLLRMRRDLIRA